MRQDAMDQDISLMNIPYDSPVALVDDDPNVLQTLTAVLKEFGFSRLHCFQSAPEALRGFETECFDVVITDFKMPVMDGFELMQKLHQKDSCLPIIMITGHADMDRAVEAFKQGAFDFIVKPYKPIQVVKELKRALSARRLSKLEQEYKEELEKRVWERTTDLRESLDKMSVMNREVIHRLGMAAEHRDDDTGAHIARIAFYVFRLARILGEDEETAKMLGLASTMHDIGKIGIPDAILFKTSALTREEFDVIKTHARIGGDILSGSSFELLELAATIAVTHHEKWDGSGYPEGLAGDRIPLGGRITMLADHYDALRSQRPYKLPFSHQKTCDIILKGDGRTSPAHFDPDVLAAFAAHTDEFDRIFNENQSLNHAEFSEKFLTATRSELLMSTETVMTVARKEYDHAKQPIHSGAIFL